MIVSGWFARFLSSTRQATIACVVCAVICLVAAPASAQQDTDLFGLPGGTTVIPRSDPFATDEPAEEEQGDYLKLVALLTADGQPIEQGLVWSVFTPLEQEGKVKLLSKHTEASPKLTLQPGVYVINAALGRAYITRKITLRPNQSGPIVEQFVLNAGGLRVSAQVSGSSAPQNTVRYNIYSDRDQQNNRRLIVRDAKPGVVVRLNSGLYQVESTYGDANVQVRADVTVEAGKLTEATVSHSAARATFKLVEKAGSEAIADTKWRIETNDGLLVKENAGAFPTHMLAPGKYTVTARHAGNVYRREFELADGAQEQIEILME